MLFVLGCIIELFLDLALTLPNEEKKMYKTDFLRRKTQYAGHRSCTQ
jgi:hypothetical protein